MPRAACPAGSAGRSAPGRPGRSPADLPPGLTLPSTTFAVAGPPIWPGYHISRMDLTLAGPRHEDRVARVQDHDRVRVGRDHRRDHVVLVAGEAPGRCRWRCRRGRCLRCLRPRRSTAPCSPRPPQPRRSRSGRPGSSSAPSGTGSASASSRSGVRAQVKMELLAFGQGHVVVAALRVQEVEIVRLVRHRLGGIAAGHRGREVVRVGAQVDPAGGRIAGRQPFDEQLGAGLVGDEDPERVAARSRGGEGARSSARRCRPASRCSRCS